MERVIVLVEGSTLLEMAKALLNATFTSSRLNVDGSPAALVQVMVAEPPDVRPVGVLRVSALIEGTTRKRRPSLENILRS
jgi:hypothetical protein